MSDALLPRNPQTPGQPLWGFNSDHTDRVTKVPPHFSGSQRLRLAIEVDNRLHWFFSEERPSMYSDRARALIAGAIMSGVIGFVLFLFGGVFASQSVGLSGAVLVLAALVLFRLAMSRAERDKVVAN